MPVKTHAHDESCRYGDYLHYLVTAAPDVLWYDVQDVGAYQGSVYGVGKYQGKCLIYEDYYGSCSGCGAWGEGGEPETQTEVLVKSYLFENKDEAFKYLTNIDNWDKPDLAQIQKAIEEIFESIQ